jgi:hypothetical protein
LKAAPQGRPPRRLGAAREAAAPARRAAAADGGWGWWKPGDVDPYLTALALDALAGAVRRDLAPAEARQALANGAGRLPRTVRRGARSSTARRTCCAHLAPLPGIDVVDQRLADLKARLGSLADHVYASRQDLGKAGLALATRGSQRSAARSRRASA